MVERKLYVIEMSHDRGETWQFALGDCTYEFQDLAEHSLGKHEKLALEKNTGFLYRMITYVPRDVILCTQCDGEMEVVEQKTSTVGVEKITLVCPICDTMREVTDYLGGDVEEEDVKNV